MGEEKPTLACGEFSADKRMPTKDIRERNLFILLSQRACRRFGSTARQLRTCNIQSSIKEALPTAQNEQMTGSWVLTLDSSVDHIRLDDRLRDPELISRRQLARKRCRRYQAGRRLPAPKVNQHRKLERRDGEEAANVSKHHPPFVWKVVRSEFQQGAPSNPAVYSQYPRMPTTERSKVLHSDSQSVLNGSQYKSRRTPPRTWKRERIAARGGDMGCKRRRCAGLPYSDKDTN